MSNQRVGGIISVQVNGEVFSAKGDWDYNLGRPKRETVVGADGIHGYKEVPQPAFIQGKFTDKAGLDLNALVLGVDLTVTLDLANGKTVVLREGWYAGEGTANTGEGEIDVRYEGKSAEEFL